MTMERIHAAAIIRLVVWCLTVAITLIVGILLVEDPQRNGVFWLTIASLIWVETLWTVYPVIRGVRSNLPLPIAATFIFLAYTALIAILTVFTCIAAVSFDVLLAIHLSGVVLLLVIPLGIVFRGGLFIAEVNESHATLRETHIQFRNNFRAFTMRFADMQVTELEDARQIAKKLEDDLVYTVTESVPAVTELDLELNRLLTECGNSLDDCARLTGVEDRKPLQNVVKTLLQKLQIINQKLSEREIINKQNKR
jgi:hypothetical protein